MGISKRQQETKDQGISSTRRQFLNDQSFGLVTEKCSEEQMRSLSSCLSPQQLIYSKENPIINIHEKQVIEIKKEDEGGCYPGIVGKKHKKPAQVKNLDLNKVLKQG